MVGRLLFSRNSNNSFASGDGLCQFRRVNLVILHSHLRPGGVRRVIELAVPHLVGHWPGGVDQVVLATGETPDLSWLEALQKSLHGVEVRVVMEPAFGYASELRWHGQSLTRRVAGGIDRLFVEIETTHCLVWAHNLGLGRNLCLARELARRCHAKRIPLIEHHHDWWFENRWQHLATARDSGFKTLRSTATAVFTPSPFVAHAAINQADAQILKNHFAGRSGWLPNPVQQTVPPSAARSAYARSWLHRKLGQDAPVWLLPCRLLRRKNIAEALLLTRWLRPEAWLVTTAGVSSAEEQPYATLLDRSAKAGGWRLRLGVLEPNEPDQPSVGELLVASEAVLLTSLQEGFGLPYLEAAAAQRPLIARGLPNIAPDLATFGFVFPQLYQELQVDPDLFDWASERARQRQLFARWKRLIPRSAAQHVGKPPLLATRERPVSVPFSRLTLTAQLEVLSKPIEVSWEKCAALNPFLAPWRKQAAVGRLRRSPWPQTADKWLAGRAYAKRLFELIPSPSRECPMASAGQAAQKEFLRRKLHVENLYPLLWDSRT